jgi:hypothetical protein
MDEDEEALSEECARIAKAMNGKTVLSAEFEDWCYLRVNFTDGTSVTAESIYGDMVIETIEVIH